MHQDHPRLTRDQLVTIIFDFYVFLTKLNIPTSALKFPPPDGWPNITFETTKDSNKSPIVIDLIKHLPYIEEDDWQSPSGFVRYINYKSQVVDYSVYTPEQFEEEGLDYGEESLQEWVERMEEEKADLEDDEEGEGEDDDDDNEVEEESNDGDAASEHSKDSGVSDMSQESENWWQGDDPDEIILRNMIVIAIGHESGGRTLVLDVFKGNIHEDIVRCMSVSAVPIEAFFEKLRDEFEKLILVPTPEEVEENGEGEADGDLKEYVEIYREFGWPEERFRKEEALVKIKECRERESLREDEKMRLQDEERDKQRAMG